MNTSTEHASPAAPRQASDCPHNYIVHHVDGKPVYICTRCGHSIRSAR